MGDVRECPFLANLPRSDRIKSCSESSAKGKFDHRAWRRRGRQSVHGITLAEILHVAQSQYHDIGVSKRLGFATCWIERRQTDEGFGATPAPSSVIEPDLHFATLAELADEVDASV